MTTWLHEERLEAVLEAVRASGARSVLDLGCGDGELLLRLAREPRIARIVGLDLSREALDRLRARLKAETDLRAEVDLSLGSFLEGGTALRGFDCAVLVETIEHVDPGRLSDLERAVFGEMRPETVIVTTPNAEFNALLGTPAHRFRHPDHRFEWDRAKFRRWAEGVARRTGRRVACRDIAGAHPELGGASQMAVFTRGEAAGVARDE